MSHFFLAISNSSGIFIILLSVKHKNCRKVHIRILFFKHFFTRSRKEHEISLNAFSNIRSPFYTHILSLWHILSYSWVHSMTHHPPNFICNSCIAVGNILHCVQCLQCVMMIHNASFQSGKGCTSSGQGYNLFMPDCLAYQSGQQ